VIETLGKGAIHVSMSTISIALSERLAAAHMSARQRFVAAPVFGDLSRFLPTITLPTPSVTR